MRESGRFLPLLTVAVCVSFGITPEAQAARPNWSKLLRQPDAWYQGTEGREAVANVLANQTPNGDWPKNVDTTLPLAKKEAHGTFDNSGTTSEIRFLARAYAATHDAAIVAAVDRGLALILKAQYPTGGWPQSYPPGTKYPRFITFNDDTMVHILELLRDVGSNPIFAFVKPDQRTAAKAAFDRGIDCILRSQVVVNGKKTVWCAQHDEKTLEPRPARAFELVSLSGAESGSILLLLMSLDMPSPAVREAVAGGVAWFETVRLQGIKQVEVDGDKKVVSDANAPPLWARFYEVETNRPFFCGRDGVKKYDIAAIEPERRNGYAWYGAWGQKVADRHARWIRTAGR